METIKLIEALIWAFVALILIGAALYIVWVPRGFYKTEEEKEDYTDDGGFNV